MAHTDYSDYADMQYANSQVNYSDYQGQDIEPGDIIYKYTPGKGTEQVTIVKINNFTYLLSDDAVVASKIGGMNYLKVLTPKTSTSKYHVHKKAVK